MVMRVKVIANNEQRSRKNSEKKPCITVQHSSSPCAMTRLTISIPGHIKDEIDDRAKAQRRSVSSYVALILESEINAGPTDELRRAAGEAAAMGVDPIGALRNAISSK
jgi:hypothetical protein